MQENEFPSGFIDIVKQMENAGKVGFDRETRLWTPHESPEGGRKTLGYGHKLQRGETYLENTPQTTAQIEQLLVKDLVKHAEQTRRLYDDHVRTTYNANPQESAFDKLDPQRKLLLVEK